MQKTAVVYSRRPPGVLGFIFTLFNGIFNQLLGQICDFPDWSTFLLNHFKVNKPNTFLKWQEKSSNHDPLYQLAFSLSTTTADAKNNYAENYATVLSWQSDFHLSYESWFHQFIQTVYCVGSLGQIMIVPATGNTCFMGKRRTILQCSSQHAIISKLNKVKINMWQTFVWPNAEI